MTGLQPEAIGPKGSPWRLRAVRALWLCSLLAAGIMVAATVLPITDIGHHPSNEVFAVGSLRVIITAQIKYAENHPDKGFASSLTELGPRSGNELIAADLSSGKRKGYVFILTAASPDPSGHVTQYAVTARPQKYGKSGTRSFLANEYGVMRFTAEDRAPTVEDPAL